MMYIRCFLLLEISTIVAMLPVHVNSSKYGITMPYRNLHPTTRSKAIVEERLSDGSRIEFQIRNHAGPGTYVFGFDTGHGKSRQYRIEERFQDGTVKGQYGFYDAKGKLRIIHYIAGPISGYQERHHESSIPET